ncbi:sigma-70 family RNA polymerase sigma factor [Streptomyces sp. NBC_01261]|uniref:RNA polymerase sigma factor n=1 Tax=Streptomyces sp. NBC_01261 TaxID=2903802 RepID=UPI002E31297C|nr:sigma-70 family RNA polymerase sigma factor [Streptomyces sp. NBC_01261]
MSDQDPLDSTDLPSATAAHQRELQGGPAAPRQVEEEFSAFYRENTRQLVGFLVNQGATIPVAADIAQDTMLKAYQHWNHLRGPRAWAHTVASRELARRVASVEEDPVEQIPEPTSLLSDPDAIAEWEDRYDLLPLLRSLPPRQRQVLAWTLDDFTPREIAQQLRITPEAVRSNLVKARRAAAAYVKAREGGQ